MQSSVPAALSLQDELGDDLQVILLERAHTLEDVQRLGLAKRWFGTTAVWSVGRPFRTERKIVPTYILLSESGEVVMQGNPLADLEEIRSYVRERRAARHELPEGFPEVLRKPWNALLSDRLGEALSHLEESSAELAANAQALEAVAELQRRVNIRVETLLRRIDAAIEAGDYIYAAEICELLGNARPGTSMANAVAERSARLTSPNAVAGMAAQRELMAVEKILQEVGPSDDTAELLRAVSRDHDGTAAARDAAALLKATQPPAGS